MIDLTVYVTLERNEKGKAHTSEDYIYIYIYRSREKKAESAEWWCNGSAIYILINN